MAEARDLSDELLGPVAPETPAIPGLDLTEDLLGPSTLHDRVIRKAGDILNMTEAQRASRLAAQRFAEQGEGERLPGIGFAGPPPSLQETVEALPEDVIGPTAGESIGAGIGLMTGPAAPIMVPVLAGFGAAGGLWLERLIAGRERPSTGELAFEFGASIVPEAVETGVKQAWPIARERIVRAVAENRFPLLRGTRGGEVLREAEAFRLIRGQGRRIFDAPSETMARQMFEFVRQSNTPIPQARIRQFLGDLTPSESKRFLRETSRADAVLNLRMKGFRSGESSRMREVMETFLRGDLVGTLDIGELQDLSSAFKERLRKVGNNPQLEETLGNAIDAIDGAIDDAFGEAPGALREARMMWRRLKAAELFEQVLFSYSGLPTGRANVRTIRFSSFVDALEQARVGGRSTKLTEMLSHSLDSIPGARERLNALNDRIRPLFKQIKLSGGADTAGLAREPRVAAMLRGFGEALLSDEGLELFEEAVVQGRGELNLNTLAIIVSAVRRGWSSQQVPQQPEGNIE